MYWTVGFRVYSVVGLLAFGAGGDVQAQFPFPRGGCSFAALLPIPASFEVVPGLTHGQRVARNSFEGLLTLCPCRSDGAYLSTGHDGLICASLPGEP